MNINENFIAQMRDAARLREELDEALDVTDGPTALRWPKGAVDADVPALERLGSGVDVLRRPAAGEDDDVLLVAVGAFAPLALANPFTLSGWAGARPGRARRRVRWGRCDRTAGWSAARERAPAG